MHLKDRGNWRSLKELMLPKKVTTENVLFPSNQNCRIISICISSISFVSIQHTYLAFFKPKWGFLSVWGCIQNLFMIWGMQHNESVRQLQNVKFLEEFKCKHKKSLASLCYPKHLYFCFILMTLQIFWNNFADFCAISA